MAEKEDGKLIELARKKIGSLHIVARENPKSGKRHGQLSRESTDRDGYKKWQNVALFTNDDADAILAAIKECFEIIQVKKDEKK